MAVSIGIKGFDDLQKKLNDKKKAAKKVLERINSDIKTRGPGWIAQGVVERYNLGGSKGAGKKDFDANEAKRKDPREIELVILKNRNGRTGDSLSFNFYPLFNYFEET